MQTKRIAFGGLVAAAVALGAYGAIAQSPVIAPAARAAQIVVAQPPFGGPHPEMRKAMRALQNARKFLMSSEHDFQGHRTKAVEHVDAAIREVREAFKANP